MRVVSFDLSSSCIGVSLATVENKEFKQVGCIPIIPVRPTGKDVGYTTDKPKKIAYRGSEFKGYLKPGEFSISKTEADKRKAQFKTLEHNHLLRNIGKQCGLILKKVQPHEVVIERNMSFNGILTTKLLAEIAGGIYFYCGANDIEMFDYPESTIRAFIRRQLTSFTYENEVGDVALDTKWEIYCRLRTYFGDLVDFTKLTLDETDSLAALYYHIMKG